MCNKFIFTFLSLLFLATLAQAQNPTCPTRPGGDSSNACASTAFVQSAIGTTSCNIQEQGAVQDGVTDDSVAWAKCNTILTARGGGWLDVPPSTSASCLKSGLTPGQGVWIRGAGSAFGATDGTPGPSIVSACGTDVTLFTFSAVNVGMSGMNVQGYAFGTKPAVVIATGKGVFEFNNIQGGAPPVEFAAGNVQSAFNFNHVNFSYGSANVLVQALGFVGHSNIYNTPWNGAPIAGSLGSISAWAATTVYSAGNIVSATGPDGKTYYIKVTSGGGGTSGGSQPTLLPYANNITDGTVTWQLLRPMGDTNGLFYDLQCDTGCAGLYDVMSDHSGAAIGFGMTNTAAGVAPNQVEITNGFFGNNWPYAVYAHDGQVLHINGGQSNSCVSTNCIGFYITGNWGGAFLLSGHIMFTQRIGVDFGVSGVNAVRDSHIENSSAEGVNIEANVNGASVTGDDLGTGVMGANVIGVNIVSGTGDYLTVTNNNFEGATTAISNTGPASGTHNLLSPNNGPVAVAAGGTNCTVASITCFNNITGFSAAGATGTTSTNLVFSTSPTLITPILGVASATSITAPNYYGGSSANSVLNLQSTSSGSPSGDSITTTVGGAVVQTTLANAVGIFFNASTTTVNRTPTTGTIDMVGLDATTTGYRATTFGAIGTNVFTRYDGTNASPTALLANEEMGRLALNGYNGSAIASNKARWSCFAEENWSTSANGTYCSIVTTTPTTTTAAEALRVHGNGHVLYDYSTAAPAVSSCGNSPSAISGNDMVGSLTAGSGTLTSCVINFAKTWGTAPICVASSPTAIASLTVTASTTQLTIGGTSLTSDVLGWICHSSGSS